jgi:tetratricopeptide (TPR) repeat protein
LNVDDARMLLETGRVAEAEAAYEELSRNPGERAQSYYGLGMVSLRKQDLASADRWFKATVDENPKDTNARFYLAELAARRGDNVGATRLLGEVLALNPQHAGALKRIGTVNAPVVAAGPGSTQWSSPRTSSVRRTLTPPIPSAAPPQPAPGLRQPTEPIASLGLPPSPPSSTRSLVGRARLVKLQAVAFNGTPGAKQSLTLRLDIADAKGCLASSIGIEMRGFHVRGSVENGDWIEVNDVSKTGKVKSLRNLSTGQQVRTHFF